MKTTKKILTVVFSVSFCIFCLLFPDSVKSSAGEGINRCILIVIPSLYAMMTASAILLKSGVISAAGRLLNPVSKLFFGINGELGAILLFSMISGYPVGAKLIYSMYTEGRISKRNTELLSGICFGSGAAFIFGCAASSSEAGRLILLSTAAANLIIAFVISLYFRKNLKVSEKPQKIAFSADMLTESVTSAGRSMGEVCLCIIIFSVFAAMLRNYGILAKTAEILSNICIMSAENKEALLCAALDVTAISGISLELPTAAALISFGGVCVFLQISAIFRGRLSIAPLIIMRTAAAALSFVICRLLTPFFISREIVDVFAVTGILYRETSPVPSVMLIIMTCVLIAEGSEASEKCKKKAVPEDTAFD